MQQNVISSNQNGPTQVAQPQTKKISEQVPDPKETLKSVLYFMSTYFPKDTRMFKLTCQAVALLLENLISYNLFESILSNITEMQYNNELLASLSSLRQMTTEGRVIRRASDVRTLSPALVPSSILQLIIASQFFISNIEEMESILKCLKLFSKCLINEKEASDWLSLVVKQLSRFFFFAISEEEKSFYNPAKILRFIMELPERSRFIAFSPAVIKCFEKFQDGEDKNIYEELISEMNSPCCLRMDQMKIEIFAMKSSTFYKAYCDDVIYNETKVVTKPMESAVKALYGIVNNSLFGTEEFEARCIENGMNENKNYVNKTNEYLSKLQTISADYRTQYIKKFNHFSIERSFFYEGFTMENSEELAKIVNAAENMSKDVPEILPAIAEFKTLLSGSEFYATIKFASSFVFLNEALRICKGKSDEVMNEVVKSILNDGPPYINFGDSELANIDIPFRGLLRGLKHINEKDTLFGRICVLTKDFFVLKVTIQSGGQITIFAQENINYQAE